MRDVKKLLLIFVLMFSLNSFSAENGEEIFLPPPPEKPDSPEIFRSAKILENTKNLSVNTQNRKDVVSFYNNQYLTSNGIAAAWTGEIENCIAGTTNQDFREAILRRINYYRAMSGLPGNIVFDEVYNAKCQDAALIRIAQPTASNPHYPQEDWKCYTEDGKDASGQSNLATGMYGPSSINGYMEDPGTYNGAVGHRRWILYPPQITMSTGDTTEKNGYYTGSNCLWVFAPTGARPETADGVSWPPPGFVPYNLVFPRWSFSFNNADFTNAEVTMNRGGNSVSLTPEAIKSGYGDNTIVWVPDGIATGAPDPDLTYHVKISNAIVGGSPRTFEYDVIIIDPSKTPSSPLQDLLDYLLGKGGVENDANHDGKNDIADIITLIKSVK
jgi:hypothetical protein